MSDLEDNFAEMVSILGQAQEAVHQQLRVLSASQVWKVQALARLGGAVDMFAGQADAVLAMMLENDASDDLLASAEALVDFFQDAKAQIASLLRVDEDNG